MKRFCTLAFMAVLLMYGLHVSAQDDQFPTSYKTTDFSGFYLGGNASTNGWGFNAKYVFNNWFALKTGFETMNFTHNFDFDENGIDYNAYFDYQSGGVLFLGDFSYTKNLYISTGIIANSFKPAVDGRAVGDYQLGDITIPAEDIGTFSMNMKPGLKVSPYVGAGYQAFMGRAKRLTFNFEMGIYYMGAPVLTIESDGLLSPTSDPAFGQAEYLSDQFSAYKIYPVIKLNLAYRIF
ncbi:hypothetical protein [Maribellus sediminis]|uniref:hypothetical protein n=1 Tax=Maribellus sediminis TaxID=2696285 RepID=UPI001430C8D5|nr:hypothetical protein [Maribellus sediminis]